MGLKEFITKKTNPKVGIFIYGGPSGT